MEDGGAAVGAGTTAVGVLNGAVEAAVAGTLRHDMYDEDAHGHLQVSRGACVCVRAAQLAAGAQSLLLWAPAGARAGATALNP